MSNLLFSKKEIDTLIKALKSYQENPIPIGQKIPSDRIIQSLTSSSINKLENFSIFTSFTKDEWTIIAFSYRAEIEVPTFIDLSSDTEFYVQLEKKILNVIHESRS